MPTPSASDEPARGGGATAGATRNVDCVGDAETRQRAHEEQRPGDPLREPKHEAHAAGDCTSHAAARTVASPRPPADHGDFTAGAGGVTADPGSSRSSVGDSWIASTAAAKEAKSAYRSGAIRPRRSSNRSSRTSDPRPARSRRWNEPNGPSTFLGGAAAGAR